MLNTVQTLNATQFLRFMASGRTSPAIFGCEDNSGSWVGEFVLKLRGGIETAESGLICELVGAGLASYFKIQTPEPALINIETALVELIATSEPERATLIRRSAGVNFGTRLVTGFTTWPVDRHIPDAMWQTATDIFAFDALIQNPDRRFNNPNLFTRGDTIFAYDHEMAFSFLFDLFPSQTPWKLENQSYLADHVFYRRLKSKRIDTAGFCAALTSLSDARVAEVLAQVPAEWNNGSLTRIESHLRAVRENAETFGEEIRRILI